jgi:hypothetical protein
MDSAGDFTITWMSNQRPSGFSIYGQRYAANGAKQANEFLVSTTTTYEHEYPTIAMDAAGDFVVAWTSYLDGQGAPNSISARRYNSSGIPQGAEFFALLQRPPVTWNAFAQHE